MKLAKLAFVIISVILSQGVTASDMKDAVDAGKRRAAEYKLDLKIPEFEDMERVKKLAEVGQERGRAAFEKFSRENHADQMGDNETGEKRESLGGLLIVALSSSMPVETVRDYMVQLEAVPEAIVVLRGFVGGAKKVADTGRWLEEVKRKNPTCRECEHYGAKTVVDPILFKELGIKQVPAIAFIPNVKELSHCDGEDFKAAFIATGVAPIGFVLDELERNGANVPNEMKKRFAVKGWEAKK